MSTKKKFTELEIALMKANLYTEKVTENKISFTDEFKNNFWKLSLKGYPGTAIFKRLGYDPEVLGFERMHNITKRIRKAARAPGGLEKQKGTSGLKINNKSITHENIDKMSEKEIAKRMQNEIVYLQQQMEFLKKIMKTEKKSGK